MPYGTKLGAHVPLMVALWAILVGFGMIAVQLHSIRPGDAGILLVDWPPESPIRRADGRPTLLIFLHPECPCSRASVAQLASLMNRGGERVAAHAIVFQPAHPSDGWGRSKLENELALVPSLSVYKDIDGREARRFGVVTSGHVLLYSTQGRLCFGGGITAARGHDGPNFGHDAALALMLGQNESRHTSPVFGCAIAAPGSIIPRESRQ